MLIGAVQDQLNEYFCKLTHVGQAAGGLEAVKVMTDSVRLGAMKRIGKVQDALNLHPIADVSVYEEALL